MFNHPPKPAFKDTHEAIRRHLARRVRDTRAGNDWGVNYEAKAIADLYADLELKRAFHGLKCEVNR